MEMQVKIYQKAGNLEAWGYGILNLETRMLKFTDCDDFFLAPYYENTPYTHQDKDSEKWQIGIIHNDVEIKLDIAPPEEDYKTSTLEDMFVDDHWKTVDYIKSLYLLLKIEKNIPNKDNYIKKTKI